MATRFAGRVGAPPTVASPRRAKLAFRGRAVVGEGVGFAIDAARLLGAAGPEDELGSVEEVFPRRAARRRRFDPEIRKQMSLEHDIPRSVLDRAFRER